MFIMPKSSETKRLLMVLRAANRGMSIVELLVGIFIGMLTILAIMSSLTTFEELRRGTSAGNDAQISATMATYLIERDLRKSGYGIYSRSNNSIYSLCLSGSIRAYNQNKTPNTFTFNVLSSFAPLAINPSNIPAGDANTDVLVINFSNSESGSGRCTFFEQSSSASANIKVANRSGFQTGDISVLVPLTQCPTGGQSEIPINAVAAWVDATKDCSVVEITGIPGDTKCDGSGGGAGQTDVVIHNNGNYNNSYNGCTKIDATWNKPGGLGVDYDPCGVVCNLGPGSSSIAYAVRSGKLTQCDLINSPCTDSTKTTDKTVWVPVADDIVSLSAELGLAANNTSQTVTAWQKIPCSATGCTPTYEDWQRLKLVRIAIVARSPQFQKTEVTTSQPQWKNGTSIKIDHLPDWKHYRYVTTEAVTPIRNVIWGSAL